MHVHIVLQVTWKLQIIKKTNHTHITRVATFLQLSNIYNQTDVYRFSICLTGLFYHVAKPTVSHDLSLDFNTDKKEAMFNLIMY